MQKNICMSYFEIIIFRKKPTLDKNARPIGLYRWAWVQTAPPTYDANILS